MSNFSEEISGKIVPAELGKILRERGSALALFCVETTGSTNADAAKMLRAGTPNFALVAQTQTAARGRVGRRWESGTAGNLCLSCGFRPDIAPEKLCNFTLWLGVALAEMLRTKFGVPACVKWPNDLFVCGKKIAGLLTEAHIDARRVRGIVFGIGMNVNLDVAALPPDVRSRATSLRAEINFSENGAPAGTGTENLARTPPVDATRVCAETILAIERAYAAFLAGTHSAKLEQKWSALDWLAGKSVVAIYGNEEIAGTARGIDSQGRIRIAPAGGNEIAFAAGDILLKKN